MLRATRSLDEITSISRKFLNIAFTLFGREDQIDAQDGFVPGFSIKCDDVKLTRFLQVVHTARGSTPAISMYALIYGLSAQEGHSHRPTIRWRMNAPGLTLSSRLRCESSLLLLSDFSLISATEARSSNLFRQYVHGPSRRDPSRSCRRGSSCSTTSHSPYLKLASTFSDLSSSTISTISGQTYAHSTSFICAHAPPCAAW